MGRLKNVAERPRHIRFKLSSRHTKEPFVDELIKGLQGWAGMGGFFPASALGIACMNCIFAFVSILMIDVTKWIFKEDIPG
jgi:hypothetical protein